MQTSVAGAASVDLVRILDGFGEYVRHTPSQTITVNARKLAESIGLDLDNNKVIGDALALMADRGVLDVVTNEDGSPHELSGAGKVYRYERAQSMRGADTLPVSKIHMPVHPLWDQTESMLDVMCSIKHAGLYTPIEVRPSKTQKEMFEVVEGATRFRACMALGSITRVRVTMEDIGDRAAVFKSLAVNLARGTKRPIDEAQAFSRVIDEGWAKQTDIARIIGRSPKFVAERLQLLDLPADVQAKVRANVVSADRALEDMRHQRLGPGEIVPENRDDIRPFSGSARPKETLFLKYPQKGFAIERREFRVDWEAQEIWEKPAKQGY